MKRDLIYKHSPVRVTFDEYGVLDTIEWQRAGNFISSATVLGRAILRYADEIRDFELSAKARKFGLAWAVTGYHPVIEG